MTDVNVYFSNFQKRLKITINPTITIGQLKAMINALPLGTYKNNFTVKFLFGNGQELAPTVFNSNVYDNINFEQYANVLEGSRIYITDPENDHGYVLVSHDTEGSSSVFCFKNYNNAIEALRGYNVDLEDTNPETVLDREYEVYPYKYTLEKIVYLDN